MLLADLDRRAIIREYGPLHATELANDFVLLASRTLSNVEDTHFHVADTVLTRTALPSALSGRDLAVLKEHVGLLQARISEIERRSGG